MRRATGVFMIFFAFAVPWEYSLDVGEPLGNVARVAGVLMLLAAIPAALRSLGGTGLRRPGPLQWLALGYFLYFALTYFWTVDQEVTQEKLRGFFQEIMIVWIIWEFARTAEDLRWFFRAFVAGCWLLAILTIGNFTSASGIAAEQIRFVAEGQDPNDVARFLDLGFPLAALLFVTEARLLLRVLALAYLPAGLMAVLLTASRGGLSTAVVAMIGSAILLVAWRPRAGTAVLLGLATCAGLAALLVPEGSLERLATIPEQLGSSDLNERVNIWTSGWKAFVHAPWFGSGAGTFTIAAGLAPFDSAHNTVVSLMVTGGLVAVSLLGAIAAVSAIAVVRTPGVVRIALGTVLAVLCLTSNVGTVEENRATWLIFALCALAGRIAGEDPTALPRAFPAGEPAHLGKLKPSFR